MQESFSIIKVGNDLWDHQSPTVDSSLPQHKTTSLSATSPIPWTPPRKVTPPTSWAACANASIFVRINFLPVPNLKWQGLSRGSACSMCDLLGIYFLCSLSQLWGRGWGVLLWRSNLRLLVGLLAGWTAPGEGFGLCSAELFPTGWLFWLFWMAGQHRC